MIDIVENVNEPEAFAAFQRNNSRTDRAEKTIQVGWAFSDAPSDSTMLRRLGEQHQDEHRLTNHGVFSFCFPVVRKVRLLRPSNHKSVAMC